MSTETEIKIHIDMMESLKNTFHKNIGTELSAVEDAMKEFVANLVGDIFENSPGSGVHFTTLRSAFRYLYVKTVDGVLIYNKEKMLLVGANTLYDYDNVLDERYGVSEFFEEYGSDPEDELFIGEQYFYSFQDCLMRHEDEIIKNPGMMPELLIGALIAIIPYAIKRGLNIINAEVSA